MINFEEELKKFHPSLEVEDAEEANLQSGSDRCGGSVGENDKRIRRKRREIRRESMFCYNCGCHLSEHDFCTSCGADVSLYKKIMCMSNRFYNDGLEKAGVRDLTGAINSLRQSLKFNKNNIEARNLLGLVYFETGEVVAALSEWVISKNMRPEKNIADDYINMLQSNAARLDAINQTIKKYNQALVYCNQDSKDLARIQLKKVLSDHPNFVQAHLLLALLYMDAADWGESAQGADPLPADRLREYDGASVYA